MSEKIVTSARKSYRAAQAENKEWNTSEEKSLHMSFDFQIPRLYLSPSLNGLREVGHRLKGEFLIYMYFMFIYSQIVKWKLEFEF